jgi:hypothetical protein
MSESQSWRRAFAAGFMALALSVGGHLATSGSAVPAGGSCPLSRSRFADRVLDRATPRVEPRGIAHRVALALLGAMFNTCS